MPTENNSIAFFCMEFAIEEELPLYAGGLGVLAGDFLLEAGSHGIPLYGIGLFYHQHLSSPEIFDFSLIKDSFGNDLILGIEITKNPVLVKVWSKSYGSATLFLLDTNIKENPPEYRKICEKLYDNNFQNFILQQLVLGIGGIKLLDTLKIQPRIFHLNEGHTSFAILGLFGKHKRIFNLPETIVSTKHTIFSAAGTYIPKDIFNSLLFYFCQKNQLDIEKVFLGGSSELHPNHFSTTKFLISFSQKVNGVSKSHCFHEAQIHPGSPLIQITNGVNVNQWQAQNWEKQDLLDLHKIWEIHCINKKVLFQKLNKNLNPDWLTIVWARRITSYKRPLLIFSDLERLSRIVNNPNFPVQILIFGRIKEDDQEGLSLESHLRVMCNNTNLKNKVIFFPDYSLKIAKKLVAGADVWLSTPEIGKEACSTSGMKSGLNGALQFSTNDGWITEVNWENIGWIIPENNVSNNLFTILESQIVPLYYSRNREGIPEEWVKRMIKTRKLILKKYTTSRMLKDYFGKLYQIS